MDTMQTSPKAAPQTGSRAWRREAKKSRASRKAEAEAKAGAMERKYTDATTMLCRVLMGVEDPEAYLKHSVGMAALLALPTVIDNFVTDFESLGLHNKRDRNLLRLTKDVKTDIERLLQHVYKSEVSSFTVTTGDEETAKRWAWDLSDLSAVFSRILSTLFGYCADENERWRVTALSECLNNLVSEEAKADKLRQIKEQCERRLRSLGFNTYEEAKARRDGMKDDLALLRKAKAEGLTVHVVKEEREGV